MLDPQPEEQLAGAAAAVDEAVRLLAHPDTDTLSRSGRQLEIAEVSLSRCVERAHSLQPGSRTRLSDQSAILRRSLLKAQGLLRHGAAFWEGWIRVRDALTAGYAALGERAEAPPGRRFSVEG